MRNTSVTSYLQMMQPLQLTLRMTFSGFWTTFLKPGKKHRSWGKTLRRYHHFIHNYKPEVIYELVYLGSTITDNLSIDSELNKRIGKAAMTLSTLTKHAWSNNKLSDHTKVNVYRACVISTLLYGSKSWTMRAHQEKRLNVFHMRCVRCILGIRWPHSKRPFIWQTGNRVRPTGWHQLVGLLARHTVFL